MLSPITAPATAAAIAPGRLTRCWKANTPPSSTAISPGNTIPTKTDDSSAGKAKVTANAAHPWRART